MKPTLIPALLALVAAGIATPGAASPRVDAPLVPAVAPSPAEVREPAPPEVIAAPPRDASIRESREPVPADVKVELRRQSNGALRVSVSRRGQVVTLRRAGARAAAADRASIDVRRGDEDTLPILWETTAPDSLTTTRGVVHLAS